MDSKLRWKLLGEENVEGEEDVIHFATLDAFIEFEQSLEELEAQKKLVSFRQSRNFLWRISAVI